MRGIYLCVLTRLKNRMDGLQKSFRPLHHNHPHLLFLCIHWRLCLQLEVQIWVEIDQVLWYPLLYDLNIQQIGQYMRAVLYSCNCYAVLWGVSDSKNCRPLKYQIFFGSTYHKWRHRIEDVSGNRRHPLVDSLWNEIPMVPPRQEMCFLLLLIGVKHFSISMP